MYFIFNAMLHSGANNRKVIYICMYIYPPFIFFNLLSSAQLSSRSLRVFPAAGLPLSVSTSCLLGVASSVSLSSDAHPRICFCSGASRGSVCALCQRSVSTAGVDRVFSEETSDPALSDLAACLLTSGQGPGSEGKAGEAVPWRVGGVLDEGGDAWASDRGGGSREGAAVASVRSSEVEEEYCAADSRESRSGLLRARAAA